MRRFLLLSTVLLAALLPLAVAAADIDSVRRELEAMHEPDQAYRRELDEIRVAARREGRAPDKERIDAIWRKINAIDSANQQRLAQVFDEFGWPDPQRFSKGATNAAFLVLQHAELPMQQKYLPLMRQAVADGSAFKQWLALLEDRVRVGSGQPQLYGSQVSTKDGVSLGPVEDEENLDARRASMGLEPICSYLKHFEGAHGAVTYAKCAAKPK